MSKSQKGVSEEQERRKREKNQKTVENEEESGKRQLKNGIGGRVSKEDSDDAGSLRTGTQLKFKARP